MAEREMHKLITPDLMGEADKKKMEIKCSATGCHGNTLHSGKKEDYTMSG